MSLSSSLYTGVSGLQAHGNKMGVIGNNIANISTVGYKGSRMHFEDFMSQDINTAGGVGQVGRGVSIGAVIADFEQGAFETTSEATDVAIGGEGFFVVSPKDSELEYYTRAGNFRFDKDGYLVDPNGNVVQGWEVRQDRDTGVAEDDQVFAAASGVQIQGVPQDIQLADFQSPPEATTRVDKMINLDSNAIERSTVALEQVVETDPGTIATGDDYYRFEAVRDDTGDLTIGAAYYVNTAPTAPIGNLMVDDAGNVVTVDYLGDGSEIYSFEWDGSRFILSDDDGAGGTLAGGPKVDDPAADHGISVKEYYDERDPFFAMFSHWDATADVPLPDSRYAYQSTIKVYDANGSAYNVTTYFDPVRDQDVRDSSGGNRHWEYMVTVNPVNDNRVGMENSTQRGVLMMGSLTFNAAGDLVGQSAFTLNEPSTDPVLITNDPTHPQLDPFANADDLRAWTPAQFSQNGYPIFTANFLSETDASFTGDDNARNIEMNFGLRNRAGSWTTDPTVIEDLGPPLIEPFYNAGQLSAEGVIGSYDTDVIPNMQDRERSALAATNYSSASTTMFQSQDGYTSGFLQNISIDRDGVMTGRYSNGQVLELYALTLADFNNKWGLRREGGNLFTETRSSGPAITGVAGTGSLGSVAGNSLEMSNVDLAKEFVKMISTEKGFQANSKTITTTDQMLTILIQMKR